MALDNEDSWRHAMRGGLFVVLQHLGREHPEDNRHRVFASGEAPLDRPLDERGEVRWRGSVDAWRLPLLLTEVPRRLALGISIVATYRREAKVAALTKRR